MMLSRATLMINLCKRKATEATLEGKSLYDNSKLVTIDYYYFRGLFIWDTFT